MQNTFIYIFVIILLSCGSQKPKSENNTAPAANAQNEIKENQIQKDSSLNTSIDFSDGPPTIIYKTKKDYYFNVPVTLNEEKTKIISYPGIKDLYVDGKFSFPVKLNDGFLLDNRGVKKNTAFLNISYEEYSMLKEVPTLAEFFSMIKDKDPFLEMYDCGNRYQYKDVTSEINKIIDEKKLDKFKPVK